MKIAQFYFNVMALYANVERLFSLMQAQTKKKENPFWLNQFLG